MDTLHLGTTADGKPFDIPAQGAIQRYITLAKSGYGKTNGGAVMCEEIYRAKVPVEVLDPLGNMWGLLSGADGESEGLPFVVFGGVHGQLPLSLDRAEYLADLVSEGVAAIFDLSYLPGTEHAEFAGALLTQLLRRAERAGQNFFVLAEEADRFAPQRAVSSPVTTFCRASRNAGVGWNFSTHKPQVLHKEVIDAANVFIGMRMTGPLAQEAVGGEIGSRVGKKIAREMIDELPTMRRGEGLFIPDSDFLGEEYGEWEPQRFKFRLRSTFHVKPPKVGEKRNEPKILAQADIEVLRKALATPEAEDEAAAAPADHDCERTALVTGLREHIGYLEQDLQEARRAPQIVEQPVFDRGELERVGGTAQKCVDKLNDLANLLNDFTGASVDLQRKIDSVLDRAPEGRFTVDVGAKQETVSSLAGMRTADARLERVAPPAPKPKPQPVSRNGELSPGAARVLEAAHRRHPLVCSRTNLAFLSGWKPTSGPFRSALKELRETGKVDVDPQDNVTLAQPPATPRTSTRAEEIAVIRTALTDAERKFFDALLEAPHSGMQIGQLEARVGWSRNSGPFRAALRLLRHNALVVEGHDGAVKINEQMLRR